MKTDEGNVRIAIQPESELEQALVAELFTRLTNVSEAPSHPERVGSTRVYYTLDIPEYEGLDHELWSNAECKVNANGQLDPEAGSRALVVVHGDPEPVEEHPDEPAVPEDVEGSEADLEAMEEGVQEVTVTEAAMTVDSVLSMDDPDYNEDLQSAAKMVSDSEADFEIPANQSSEDIVDDLIEFMESLEGDE